MITEAIIDAQIQALQTSDFDADLAQLTQAQPYLMDYLTNEDNGAFTAAEQELLLFAGLVIYRSITSQGTTSSIIKGEKFAELEEKNFELLQTQKAKGFRERITIFFEQSSQEDLLAFIEDLLLDEESNDISPEGREPLFITLKTTMDVLLGG